MSASRSIAEQNVRHQGRQGYSSSSLNVIVESRDDGAILFKQTLGIGETEILKVDDGVGEEILAVTNELVDEFAALLVKFA
jgi:hypothetical protein